MISDVFKFGKGLKYRFKTLFGQVAFNADQVGVRTNIRTAGRIKKSRTKKPDHVPNTNKYKFLYYIILRYGTVVHVLNWEKPESTKIVI